MNFRHLALGVISGNPIRRSVAAMQAKASLLAGSQTG